MRAFRRTPSFLAQLHYYASDHVQTLSDSKRYNSRSSCALSAVCIVFQPDFYLFFKMPYPVRGYTSNSTYPEYVDLIFRRIDTIFYGSVLHVYIILYTNFQLRGIDSEFLVIFEKNRYQKF